MAPETIRRGQHGTEVEHLQRLLRRAGQPVVVDGVYGARTQAAVAAFVRTQGQSSSGARVDADTLRRLEQVTQRGRKRPPRMVAPRERAQPQKKKHGSWSRSRWHDGRAEAVPLEVVQSTEGPERAEAAEAEVSRETETTPEPAVPPPPVVPGLVPDPPPGADLLGVQDEARAVARRRGSRRTGTPLSIGLFGDWGSGKSFFMSKLQEEIESRNAAYTRLHARLQDDEAELAALQERWHGRIAQITFNAWHFAEPNLWASLVTRVFDELASIINPGESLEDTRARLLAEVSEGKQRREQAKLELRKAEQALAEARTERERREGELTQLREELAVVKAVAPDRVRAHAEAEVGGARASATVESEAAEVAEQLRVGNPFSALRVTLRWVWTRGRWSRVALVAAIVLVVTGVVLLVAWWRKWLDLQPQIAMASTALGVGTGVVSTVAAWWAVIQPRLLQTQVAHASYVENRAHVDGFIHRALQDLLQPRRSALGVAEQRLEEAEVGLESAQLASEEAAEQVARARRMLQELEGGRRFYAFVRDRDESDDYRQHLGLVSMIRQDFARLEDILDQVEREGPSDGEVAPLTRIVLYIDDLDRCEPERVVEVLQAVHLLLATSIFVVVVAVDVRWLRRSLTLHYDRLLQVSREGGPGHEPEHEARPTPKNYLEKIFQIPFSLRPMDAQGFGALVEGVVGPKLVRRLEEQAEGAESSGERPGDGEGTTDGEAGASGASERDEAGEDDEAAREAAATRREREQDVELSHDTVLTLEVDELEFMKGLHRVIDTPRLAKALVNTYRLLRAEIEAEALSSYLADGVHRGVLTLLAIQVGRSDDAARLFEMMHRTECATLGEVLQALGEQAGSDRREARWQALLAAVTEVGTAECRVAELVAWADRIRRFSFNPWPTH